MADTHYFFDASALVKRYVVELGTEEVDWVFSRNPVVMVSWLSYAECLATFWRLAREKMLAKSQRQALIRRFLEDWSIFRIVRETTDLERIVFELVGRQPVRGADAVQLGAALFMHEQGLRFTWVCSDQRLANVARDEGLPVISPGND